MPNSLRPWLLLLPLTLAAATTSFAQPSPEAKRASLQRGAWLKDSRFALFVHWGLYSELGGEWKGQTHYGIAEWIMNRARIPAAEYAKVAERFNPTEFNAREWVRLAKAAGMRHIMITAKHHEGFAMYKSAASPFNIVDATPFRRDPLKELADACKAEGLRLGFYYSQTQDWHEPDAIGNSWDAFPQKPDFQRYLHGKAIPQIEELLRGYGPIAGIWFDTPGPITPAESKLLVDKVRQLQPGALVNSRIGNDLGDYDTLGDQEIPRLPREGLWETPDTLNDTWGYAKNDLNWKSPREVAQRLVRVVSRGGTYMLNVGPDGKGRIPADCQKILREVGAWVTKHEDAIHGADPTPLGPLPWGECTARGGKLYLHVFDWPADGRLIVPGLASQPKSATLLDGSGRVTVERLSESVVLRVPKVRPHSLIPVIALNVPTPVQATRDQYVLNGSRNHLETGIAKLTDCKMEQVSWMEKFGDWKHAQCLSGWSGDASNATWTFNTVEPGVYDLEVEYTCPDTDDYSEWQLTLDGRRITFPLIDTGERERRKAFGGPLPRFRAYRIGRVELTGPGKHTLILGPAGAAGAKIRISDLTLSPIR